MKTVTTVLLMLLPLSAPAFADNEIEVGKCYPGNIFFYHLVKKFSKHSYEIRSLNVPPVYTQALFETDYEIKGTGMIGGRIKIVGQKEVELDNGFTKKLYVFKDCKE